MISEGQVVAAFGTLWVIVTGLAMTIYRDMKARIVKLEEDNAGLQKKLDENEADTRKMSQAALTAMERQGAELAAIRELLRGHDGPRKS